MTFQIASHGILPTEPWLDTDGLEKDQWLTNPELDGLVSIARTLFGTSAAFVSILGRQYQWFLAGEGLDINPAPIEVSVCKKIVFEQGKGCVPNTDTEPSLSGNPYISSPQGIKFYAGVPIVIDNLETGASIYGAFCVADTVPKNPSPLDLEQLSQLAKIAQSLIEARIAKLKAVKEHALLSASHIQLTRRETQFKQAEQMVAIGNWRLDLETQKVEWSPGVYAIHELPMSDNPPLEKALSYYPQEARATLENAIETSAKTGKGFDLKLDFTPHLGQAKRVHAIASVEYEVGKAIGIVGVFRDITEQFIKEKSLEFRASTDLLTGLKNRAWADAKLERLISEADQADRLTVIMIDLNGFKAINDIGGHSCGDIALQLAADRLREFECEGCSIARYGGDEFLIILHGAENVQKVESLVNKINLNLHFPIDCTASPLWVSAAVGIATSRPDETAQSLVDRADQEMYVAKAAA